MSLSKALDQFPAAQLRDTLSVTKQLVVWMEERVESGAILSSLPISKLVDAGFRPGQVRAAVEVLKNVHRAKYGSPSPGGILTQPPPSPKIADIEGVPHVQGLIWIPFSELDQELSKREGVAPSSLVVISYSLRDGIHLLGSHDRPCILTGKEYECLALIHLLGTARLKDVAKKIKSTLPNTSRYIRQVNTKFAQTIGSKRYLIRHTNSAGYYLDQMRFSVTGH